MLIVCRVQVDKVTRRAHTDSDIMATCMMLSTRSQLCVTQIHNDQTHDNVERFRRSSVPIGKERKANATDLETSGEVAEYTRRVKFAAMASCISHPGHVEQKNIGKKRRNVTYLTNVNSSVTPCTPSNLMISRPKSGFVVR
jgi:hypothetical protein